MKTRDFHYDLPERLIAQHPLSGRTDSRLLYLNRNSGTSDLIFSDITRLLRKGDLLVMNNTRVIPARLYAQKDTGGKVEILIERLINEQHCLAQIRASKTPASGCRLQVTSTGSVDSVLTVTGRQQDLFELHYESKHALLELLESAGHVPLPPYIKREQEKPDAPQDLERYQTVYATQPGAVAAPTAGLHFDQGLLDELAQVGVQTAYVTLHVGAGTFQPVRTEYIKDHQLHAEYVEVNEYTAALVNSTRAAGGRVIAVGTTSVRCLEAASHETGQPQAFLGDTRLFIYPGYKFKTVGALITNFHLPESSLLMLVCAFAGYETTMRAYRHAISQEYRFFSYGDAMFID